MGKCRPIVQVSTNGYLCVASQVIWSTVLYEVQHHSLLCIERMVRKNGSLDWTVIGIYCVPLLVICNACLVCSYLWASVGTSCRSLLMVIYVLCLIAIHAPLSCMKYSIIHYASLEQYVQCDVGSKVHQIGQLLEYSYLWASVGPSCRSLPMVIYVLPRR